MRKKKGDGRGRRLRVSAWALALMLALAGWLVGDRVPLGLILQLSAGVVFAVGSIWPYAFESLHRPFTPSPPAPAACTTPTNRPPESGRPKSDR